MPSHRDRSASPWRHHGRPRDRDRDRDRNGLDDHREGEKKHKRQRETSPASNGEDLLDVKQLGVDEITEEDYFLKSGEFKLWLKEEKEKYLDEMSSEAAHKYFRRFVRRWNDGALKQRYYRPLPTTSMPSSSNTAYKWSFANNRSRVDSAALAAARADVDRLTHAKSSSTSSGPVGPSLPSSSRPLGPTLPTAADRQFALESSQDDRRHDRQAKLKDGYARADEMVPKSGGKEGKMEEKRATNAENRQFREKDATAGLEADEGTLMGENEGFATAVRARDAAQARRMDKKAVTQADRTAADKERLSERKQKESATMDMFKALAKERFG